MEVVYEILALAQKAYFLLSNANNSSMTSYVVLFMTYTFIAQVLLSTFLRLRRSKQHRLMEVVYEILALAQKAYFLLSNANNSSMMM